MLVLNVMVIRINQKISTSLSSQRKVSRLSVSRFHLMGNMNVCIEHFMAIHPIAVKILLRILDRSSELIRHP